MRIKLSADRSESLNDDGAPEKLMLQEMLETYPRNPINDRELLIGYAKVEVQRDMEGGVLIKSIEAMIKGAGYGRAALQVVADLADKHKVPLSLFAVSFDDAGLDEAALKAWYGRHGFTTTNDDYFRRPAGGVAAENEIEQERRVTDKYSMDAFPLIRATQSERRLKAMEESLVTIQKALAEQQILNPVFKDVKELWNRIVDDAYKVVLPWTRETPEDVESVVHGALLMSVHDCKAATKRANATKLDHPAIHKMREFMQEVAPIIEAFDTLKPLVVKRIVKTAEQRAEDERFVPPPASKKAARAVYEALDAITKKHYEAMAGAFKSMYLSNIERFEEADLEGRKKIIKDVMRRAGVFDAMEQVDRETLTYKRTPDADATLTRLAAREAQQIQERFISKNLRKLASIIDLKGDFLSLAEVGSSVSISGLQGMLRVKFKDGSKFDVNNTVVRSYSVYGTPFLRYPLTFHDVTMPDGSRMPQPSEERMNSLFVKAPEPTATELAEDAHGRFADGCAIAVAEASWTIDEAFPLAKLGDVVALKSKFEQHCARAEEEGRLDECSDLIGQPIRTPIVVLVAAGKPSVWDGELRVGAAAYNGQSTIRAVVGVPLAELTPEHGAARTTKAAADVSNEM